MRVITGLDLYFRQTDIILIYTDMRHRFPKFAILDPFILIFN